MSNKKNQSQKAVLGARLRKAREDAHVCLEDAAEAAGVQTIAVKAWERGSVLPNLLQFRDVMGCYGKLPLDVLIGDNPYLFSGEEARELRGFNAAFSPALRRRVELLLAVSGREAPPMRAATSAG